MTGVLATLQGGPGSPASGLCDPGKAPVHTVSLFSHLQYGLVGDAPCCWAFVNVHLAPHSRAGQAAWLNPRALTQGSQEGLTAEDFRSSYPSLTVCSRKVLLLCSWLWRALLSAAVTSVVGVTTGRSGGPSG